MAGCVTGRFEVGRDDDGGVTARGVATHPAAATATTNIATTGRFTTSSSPAEPTGRAAGRPTSESGS